MKKSISTVLCRSVAVLMLILLAFGSFSVYAEKPQLTAEASILIDGNTGTVLFEKNSTKRMFPASTTKIMTALVALEAVENGEISLEQPLVMTDELLKTLDPDGSSIALKKDESMTLLGLIKGLLIASGNDAAVVIAEGVGGSVEAFVERMNQKAAELGLADTHFVNPHGLHHENHYTTASDMARLAKEAMKNPTFRDIVSYAHVYLPATNMQEERYFINTNNLVSLMRYPYYFYDKATGIKTGSTTEAGYCLVSSAEDRGKFVISVVFNAEDIAVSHNESKAVLQHGLEDFNLKTLAKRDEIFGEVKVSQAADGTGHILLSAANDMSALFPQGGDAEKVEVVCTIPDKVRAPIYSGQVIGSAAFMYEGKEIGRVDLCSTEEVERHFLGFIASFFEWLWSFKVVKLIVYSILGLIIAFVVLFVRAFVKALKKSKRKKRRQNHYSPPKY